MESKAVGRGLAGHRMPAWFGLGLLMVTAACGTGGSAQPAPSQAPPIAATPARVAVTPVSIVSANQPASWLFATPSADANQQVFDVDIYGPFGGLVGNVRAFTAVINGPDPSLTPPDLLYTWDFGDGASADGKSVKHTYAQTGKYTLVVTVGSRVDPTVHDTESRELTITAD